MGMFDFVRSEVLLPDGFTGELQTKSLHSTLSTILIRADGRLMVEEVEYEKAPFEQGPSRRRSRLGFLSVGRRKSSRWRDLNFHATSSSTDLTAKLGSGTAMSLVSHTGSLNTFDLRASRPCHSEPPISKAPFYRAPAGRSRQSKSNRG